MKKKIALLAFGVCACSMIYAQYTTDKLVGEKHENTIDSLKTSEYPYLLPIWGEKVARKGFKLPKSAGISAQYIYQQSDIVISNLQVGFNGGQKYNLDQIVRFNNAVATSNGVNIRPDVWVFPFLNVYAIFAKSKTSTAIDAGVWVPDSSTWNKILDLNTKANFDATTYGFGITPTVGFGGFFIILDVNFTWTDISALNKPAFASIFGPRIGKTITWANRPERAWTIWAGGFRVNLNSTTEGNLSTSELFPVDEWGKKIDTASMKVDQSQQKVDAWWEGLTPVEQKNPVNIAKYGTANAALAKAGGIIDAASEAVSNAGSSSVQYSLDKTPKAKWNFLIGTQFQINRSWMIRAEYGFLGARTQFIGGLQYRFNF